ncbi:MAG: hypothetical protein WCG85_09115 [Polyangia bacterium]
MSTNDKQLAGQSKGGSMGWETVHVSVSTFGKSISRPTLSAMG